MIGDECKVQKFAHIDEKVFLLAAKASAHQKTIFAGEIDRC